MKNSIVLTLIFALISCTLLCIPVSATTINNAEKNIEYLGEHWINESMSLLGCN